MAKILAKFLVFIGWIAISSIQTVLANDVADDSNSSQTTGQQRGQTTIPPTYFGEPKNEEAKATYKQFLKRFEYLSKKPEFAQSQKALEHGLAFHFKHHATNGKLLKQCGGDPRTPNLQPSDWLVITDYTLPKTRHRQFFINIKSGEVVTGPAAHGHNSNTNCPESQKITCSDGRTSCKVPVDISGVSGSDKSPRGFFLKGIGGRFPNSTFVNGEPQTGGNESNFFQLYGLNETNKLSLARTIVWHRASYVEENKVKDCSDSGGCPSTNPKLFEEIKNRLTGGVFFYNHTIIDQKNDHKLPDC